MGLPHPGVEDVGQALVDFGHEVAVGVHRHHDRRVPEPPLDGLGVRPLSDEPGGVGVAEVVEPQRALQASGFDGRIIEDRRAFQRERDSLTRRYWVSLKGDQMFDDTKPAPTILRLSR